MVKQAPSLVTSPPLHLQGKPYPPYFQNVSRRRHRRATPSTLLLRPPIPSSQIFRGRQSGYKPLFSQPTHRLSYLQNANSGQSSELHPLRSSLHLHRSLRCIPPHPYPPPIPEIPGVHPRGQAVFLQSNAIRDQYRPKNILPGGHRGPETPAQKRNLGLGVHRRLAALEQVLQHPHLKHFADGGPPQKAGLHHKPGEVSANPDTDNHLPGDRLVRNTSHPPSQQQIHRERHLPGSGIPSATNAFTQTVPDTPGLNQLCCPLHQTRPPPFATDHPHRSKFQVLPLSQAIRPVPSTPPMVDPQGEPGSPHPDVDSSSSHDSLDGCFENRMGGGILKQHHGQGPLDPRRSTPPHQLPGVSGSHPFPSGSLPSTELRDHDQVRQHGSGLPDQQAGVQQKQEPVPSPTGPPLPLQPSLLDPQSPSSAGSPECLGRLPIPQPSNQSGMVPLSSQFPKANSKSSGTADRPLRTSRERETSDLRLPLPVPNSDGRGCPNSGLEPVGEDLPLSPSRPPPNLPTETSSLRRHGPHRRTLPSLRPLVARVPRGLHPTRRRLRGRTMGTRRVAAGTRNDILSLSRIQFLQRIYALKYDASVAEALSSALRQSTRSQYEHSWKDFQRWLAAHPNKPITKATILLYLTQLAHSKELSPKTILVYRNSLKLPLLYGFSINTSDREFSLLARSQFLANPPPKKIIPAWNPNKVLSMFEQPQFSNSRATPSRLLMKTLFLVALASGNRVSEIAAFSRAGSKILPGSKKATLAVHPGFLYKNQTMDRTPPNIIINALLNPDKSPHRLCPVDALHHWLRLSEPWGEDAVFINPKTRKKMNRGAVSLLLVTAINQANPRVFAKAHDVRKISATLAWTRGVPPHQIVQTMFWKSTTVFIKKYLVPIHSGSPP